MNSVARNAKSTTESTPDGTRAVDRAVRLIEVVATSVEGLNLSTAARTVGLPVSTAARLLRSLEATGFVWRDSNGVYRAGARILQIGAIAVNHHPLNRLAEPHLRDLADSTGETSYLAILDGDSHAVYLKQVESPKAIRHAFWSGRSIPIAGTAVGAALLGRVGTAGYALARGTGIEPEAAAAAAPIFDGSGRCIAAISIIGPSFRISDEQLVAYGESIRGHARQLSGELGHQTL